MNQKKTMPLAKRVAWTMVAVALLSTLTMAYAVWSLGVLERETKVLGNEISPQTRRIAEMRAMMFRMSLEVRHGMLMRTPQAREDSLATVGKYAAEFKQLAKDYESRLESDIGRKKFSDLRQGEQRFWDTSAEIGTHIRAANPDAALTTLTDKLIPARDAMLASLSALQTWQQQAQDTEIAASAAVAQRARVTLSVAAVVLIGASLGLGLLLVRSVRRQLGGDPTEAQAVVERVADGDLSVPIALAAGDRSSLLASMQRMQGSLVSLTNDVRLKADSVATASAQIASGNMDLSQRTERQASALQQTAAAMEELGATVRQNADNARQANQLAMGASSVASQGGELVGQVVQTMRGIEDSSKRIAEIIGTIDSIAFQTNILALNAAVEAARAGEQGRGFAVVAGEVRSLAQRSAEAAREIKDLISTSVQRVEQGSAQVDQAGAKMDEIVQSIKRVTDIVGEISSASQEQASGIGQVRDAVTDMDRTTQQNAALVEESAAAAESLKSQAKGLVQAMSAFRTSAAGGTAAGQPAASTVAAAPSPTRQPALTGGAAKPAAAKSFPDVERRSPQRAKNVVRPSFGATPAATATPAAQPAATSSSPVAAAPTAGARSGTDDEWESF
jgi:methyl-accepting chemotaxis protein